MTAPERPFWIRAEIPRKVLDDLLWPVTHAWRREEWVMQHYAPIFVAKDALEACSEEVGWVLNEALRWLREERNGNASPAPTEDELTAHFGSDRALVSTIWPVIRFVQAVRERRFDDLKLWEEARLLLNLFHPARHDPGDEWLKAVARLVGKVVKGARASQREEAVQEIALRLLRTPDRALTYEPSGTTTKVVKTFFAAVMNLAGDLPYEVVSDVDPKTLASFGASLGGFAQATRVLRPSTLRGYKHRGLISAGAPKDEIERVARANARRAHHQPDDGWMSLSQLARLMGRPLSTVRKVVQHAVARGEIGALRPFGKAKAIAKREVPVVQALLASTTKRGLDGLNLSDAAIALGLTKVQTLALIRGVAEDEGLTLPKVRRAYRLPAEWMDRLRRERDRSHR